MILLKLVICNFRSFYGTQTVNFSRPGERAVTVIHGENGGGKTNFLNAIYWCLTGKFTARLQNPSGLINRAAWDESKNPQCYVALRFEHEDIEYQATRTLFGQKSELVVVRIDSDAPRTIDRAEVFIDKIIPSALSKWFFFDAEAIGELELSGSENFKQSLRRILGFELVDSLKDDLDTCLNQKQAALARVVNSKSLDEIKRQIDNLSALIPSQKSKVEELEQASAAADAHLEKLDKKLRELPSSKPLMHQRSQLEQRRKNVFAELKEARESVLAQLAKGTPAILMLGDAKQIKDLLIVKENSGRLPAPYSEQLVEDLLHKAECLCGRPLCAGSIEYDKISSLKKKGSNSEFNNRIRNIQFAVKEIEGASASHEDELYRLEQRVQAKEIELGEIDEDLKRIRKELDGINEDQVSEIEKERREVFTRAKEFSGELKLLLTYLSNNQKNLADLNLRFEKESQKLGVGDAIKKEIRKIKTIKDYLTESLRQQEIRALNILQIELNRVLDLYLTKHFKAKIDPRRYRVDLLDQSDRPVGDSTGEGQVLRFAFITAVVALAGRKTQEKIEFLAEPTLAPLVLDAPFSALDPEYQSSVARNLAANTTQLVLLLSSAGWGQEIEKVLTPHVGGRYLLVSRQAGDRGDKPIKKLNVAGQSFQMNEYNAERDETSIREVV